ncbi:adenosylcobalamin-dependent ribonucleoside-diphosphate reductase [Gillisia sp. M10.2A]|uniref:Vitamin B12-dependent ribonucleotide reductase n=1 Tax=Gillisia lutea TaxID=2909668 RepID=A0ABS9EE24_9FLAO|nr:adenosylcobalamin-dependent ribonucleoside-diphosphate reductase [Gillisia lutea]MCF4101136.1 adenosylcobalamin-dependent ribonucleoside-diphosphate reductase [Gillisia lutea]
MIGFTKNALEIISQRYLLKDAQGMAIETPKQLFERVAKCVAVVEKEDFMLWKQRFYKLMSNFYFLPNSPTLMNAGTRDGQLSACFVLPVEDSLNGIFTSLKNAALIHQSGGGTGFNFSKLRPKGSWIDASGGTSSGPLAFIKIFDVATEYVKQGGKRRGANMGILNVDHPDIEEFITSKSNSDAIKNFNLSVGITDAFMLAVQENKDWKLLDPASKEVRKTVKAAYLWQEIVNQAWNSGDPGLIFLDTINKHNPLPKSGEIQSTNPCGEVPLLDYESCNLGSINLSKMIKIVNGISSIDWEKLAETTRLAIRFLDNIIDANYYILPEIEQITKAHRKIGLGVMGWAEMLLLLKIPYASTKALLLAEELIKFIQGHSYKSSHDLAIEKGEFPEFRKSSHPQTFLLRNATCNSIAPTGSIAVIADASYSIEPLFALAYKRVGILNGITQTEINTPFINTMKQEKLWNKTLNEEVLKKGSVQHIKGVPEELKHLFRTSLEIPWKYHLLHQKAFQKFTDNAVSKTINLPENTTPETISDIYMNAWKYQLKGITIYRYGSKPGQVLQKCGPDTNLSCDI